jgi:hypothetical protein
LVIFVEATGVVKFVICVTLVNWDDWGILFEQYAQKK